MAVKSGIGTGVIAVLAADTTILDTSERVRVSGASLHNTNPSTTVIVTVFISPNLASVGGDRVEKITLAGDETRDVGGIIGQGYVDNIIYVADVTGVNSTLTYTLYTGSSV